MLYTCVRVCLLPFCPHFSFFIIFFYAFCDHHLPPPFGGGSCQRCVCVTMRYVCVIWQFVFNFFVSLSSLSRSVSFYSRTWQNRWTRQANMKNKLRKALKNIRTLEKCDFQIGFLSFGCLDPGVWMRLPSLANWLGNNPARSNLTSPSLLTPLFRPRWSPFVLNISPRVLISQPPDFPSIFHHPCRVLIAFSCVDIFRPKSAIQLWTNCVVCAVLLKIYLSQITEANQKAQLLPNLC